ncbi:MAG: C25 family cysteine peptidase [Candidatus Hydrothermales bacterium]
MIFVFLIFLEIKFSYKFDVKAETLKNLIRFRGQRVFTFEKGLPDLPSFFIPVEIDPKFDYDVSYKILKSEIIKGDFDVERVPEVKDEGLSYYDIKTDFKKPFPINLLINQGLSFLRLKPVLSIIFFPVVINEEGIKIIKEVEIILKEKGTGKLNFKEIQEDEKFSFFYSRNLIKNTEKEFLPLNFKKFFFFDDKGLWIKITVYKNGLYLLTYEDVKRVLNIEPSQLDIRRIALYRRLKALPPSPDSSEVEPEKVPLLFIDRGIENIFDQADSLIFPGFTATGYRIEDKGPYYYFNPYTDCSFYFISFEGDSGLFVNSVDGSPTFDFKSNEGIRITRHEKNIVNLAKAGLRWIGEAIKNDSFVFYLLNFKNPSSETALINFNLIIRERENLNQPIYTLNLFMNKDLIYSKNYFSSSYPYEDLIRFKYPLTIYPVFKLNIQGFINVDFFEVIYSSKLIDLSDTFSFYLDPLKTKNVVVKGNFKRKGKLFKILSTSSYFNLVNFFYSEDSLVFNPGLESDTYLVMYSESLIRPEIERFSKKELRKITGAHMLIIGPKEFKNVFSNFIVHRRNNFFFDTLKVENPSIQYVDINEIFDEFGFGVRDPVALRNYLKFSFLNYNPRPIYVLLAGKGTYDYKNYESGGGINLVPPYEWGYGVDINNPPFTYDNFFVEFDGGALDPDMIIGRIPAKNLSEIYEFIDRTIQYETKGKDNTFKVSVLGVADDTTGSRGSFDGINHTSQVTRVLGRLPNYLDKNTLYMIDYPYVHDRKPDATRDLLRYIERGMGFIFFFIHGNPNQLAHEELLKIDDIDLFYYNKKPSFVLLGSCKTMNFDRPSGAIGEKWLIKNGIGALGSTYLTFPSENEFVIDNFFRNLFYNKLKSFGSAVYSAILFNIDYVFLGDPSTFFNTPSKIDNFLYIPDTLYYSHFSDSLFKFFSTLDSVNVKFNEYSEIAVMKIESSAKIESLRVRNNILYPLFRKGNILFKGLSEIKNLEASFKFKIPFLNSKFLRITVLNPIPKVEICVKDSIPTSLSKDETVDFNPPKIYVSVNGKELKENDTLPKDFNLSISLEDESGINIATDTIILQIGSLREPLNDYFYYKPKSFNEGFISYRVKNLSVGKSYLSISAYDLFHNRAFFTRNIFIEEEDTLYLKVKDVLPYPNPASDFVYIGFRNNKVGLFKVKIYTIRGIKIFESPEVIFNEGFNSIRFNIDKRISNGLYFFILEGKDLKTGKKVKERGKLIVYR